MGTPGEDDFVPPLASTDMIESKDDLAFLNESSEIENFYEGFVISEEDLYLGYDASTESDLLSFEEVQQKIKESNLFYSFYAEQEEVEERGEEEEDEKEKLLKRIYSSSFKEKKKFQLKQQQFPHRELRRRSLFVHSSPTNFPDINKARKSVFGSIFLTTPADVAEETALLKTVVESSYTALQSLLNSFEKILCAPSTDKERRKNAIVFRDSIQKALEIHGICKTYADGTVYWNIYPITQNYLFTVQIGDNLHQTRHLSKIEERIVAGSLRKLRVPYSWPTGSIWYGHWDALSMGGSGTYSMPHGVSYDGKMYNGMFHDDDATLTYPNKFKAVHCVYEKGKLLDCQFQFPDKLMHKKQNWQYCKFPDRRFRDVVYLWQPFHGYIETKVQELGSDDAGRLCTQANGENDFIFKACDTVRRSAISVAAATATEEKDWFWSEVQNGLKPAKIAQKTQIDPPEKIPPNSYDTGDGFYSPKSLMLVSSRGNLLRVPVCEEDAWIRKYCRKGFSEHADYRPDLFENWFDYDYELIQSILNMQSHFRSGKITYDELQQFYADLGLLPACSKYKKRKSPSEIAMEEYMKTIPPPKRLEKVQPVKKYAGHELPKEVIAALNQKALKQDLEHSTDAFVYPKFSRSLLKHSKESKVKDRNSQTQMNAKPSRISFQLAADIPGDPTPEDADLVSQKRKIPEKYLAYQPFIKLPFESKNDSYLRSSQFENNKCLSKKSVESSGSSALGPEDGDFHLSMLKKKLEKFMKSIILEIVTDILLKERERDRKRLMWASEFPKADPGLITGKNKKCLKILEQLFESIPEKEEFCELGPNKTCDLRKLAEDKRNELKFWGKRIFYLNFDDETKAE